MKQNLFKGVVFFFLFLSRSLYPQEEFDLQDSEIRESVQQELRYEELVDLALKHGIDTRGSRIVLEERLANISKIQSSVQNPPSSSGGQLVRIEQADSGSYLRGTEGNEVRLQGNVIIVTENETDSGTHTISADLILYNQETSQLSASTNVTYYNKSHTREYYFFGEQLLFSLNKSDSLFVQGSGQEEINPNSEAFSILQQLKGNKEMVNYYRGEFISRSQDNNIIMNNGYVTSSLSESPNYRLEFEQIWLLSPGEIGIENATLYIGNIPLFYLPYLYLPGNEIVFNPVFLYDDIRGFGLHTTTYLVGRKPKADLPFSFLQFDSEVQNHSQMGIFLQPSSSEDNKKDSEIFDFAKLYADIYTKRGFFLGLDLDFKQTDTFDVDVFTLLALTRELYTGENAVLTTQYYDSDSDQLQSVWHESQLAGIQIPLRYILDLNVLLDLPSVMFKLSMPIYSDPMIEGEFSARQETIPWNDIIFGNVSSLQTLNVPQKNMTWDLEMSLSYILPDFLKPFISSFRIFNTSLSLQWQIEQRQNLSNEHMSALNSPEYHYYVPRQLQLPGSISISGTILNFPLQANNIEYGVWPKPPKAIDEFQIPGTKGQTYSQDHSDLPEPASDKVYSPYLGLTLGDSNLLFSSPTPLSPPSLSSSDKALSYSLKYSIKNSHYISVFFENFMDDVDNEDGRYEWSYTSFNDDLNISLNQNFVLFQSFFSLSTSLTYKNIIRENVGFSDKLSSETINALDRQQKSREAQEIGMSNNTTFNLFNLFYTNLQLSITHGLAFSLWKQDTTEDGVVETTKITWDEESVSSHSMNASFSVPLFNNLIKQNLNISYTLPPRTQDLSINYSFNTNPFNFSLNYQLAGDEEDKRLRPLNLFLNTNIRFLDQLSLNGNIRWLFDPDINGGTNIIDRSSIGLKAFWYTANINFNHSEKLLLNAEKTAWVVEGEEKSFDLSSMQHRLIIPLSLVKSEEVRFNLNMNTSWNHDFRQFTSSSLSFDLSIDFLLSGILFFRISTRSTNNHIYKYFPGYADKLNLPQENFFMDLFRSFNFFDINERTRSNFKIQSIGVELLHDLGDWMLRLEYTWLPRSVIVNGRPEYRIENKLNFFLQWLPIVELKTDINVENIDNEWIVDY